MKSLRLSETVRPQLALTPILLAKYNITFHDAIGRPPRILDYSCFINYKVRCQTLFEKDEINLLRLDLPCFSGRFFHRTTWRELGESWTLHARQCSHWKGLAFSYMSAKNITWIACEHVDGTGRLPGRETMVRVQMSHSRVRERLGKRPAAILKEMVGISHCYFMMQTQLSSVVQHARHKFPLYQM